MKYDVIIIGAGPTGLMAAVQLARYGVNFLIIDSKPGPTEQSRAIVITARSLEIYQQLGISDVAIEQGRFIENFSVFIKGKEKVSVPVGELGKGQTDFSYLLAFEQNLNEHLLWEKLKGFGHNVSWNTELISIQQQNDHATVSVKYLQKNNTVETITAGYVIGCDGARSIVRHSLGFSFKGGTYEKRFYVADTKLKWDEAYNKLMLFPSREAFVGIFSMAGNSSHRIIGSVPRHLGDDESLSFADLEHDIKNIIGFPVEVEKLNWFSIYRLHHRAVDAFRKRNCFVAGDAAHIHSPAGGQGMNTGLQDAYNLTWKLALVIKGIANEKLLDTYNEERLPFAKWLLRFTDRGFSVMTSSNIFIDLFRRLIIPSLLKYIFRKPGIRKRMFPTISQLGWSYDKGSLSANLYKQKIPFKAGDRLPYVMHEGKSIYLQLNAPVFHLLLIGDIAEPAISKYRDQVKLIRCTIEDWKALGVEKGLCVLVRPDNYIGLISGEMNEAIFNEYFTKHCHFL